MNLTTTERKTLEAVLTLLEERGYDGDMLHFETLLVADGMNLCISPYGDEFGTRFLVANAVHATLQAIPAIYLDSELVTEPPNAYVLVYL